MDYRTIKISKEEYDDYKETPRGSMDRFADRHLSFAQRYGYGFYSMNTFEENGEYYVQYCLGSHCD